MRQKSLSQSSRPEFPNTGTDDPVRGTSNTGISLRALAPPGSIQPWWFRFSVPLLDHLLGIHTLDTLYHRHRLQDLPPFEFITRTLDILGVKAGSIHDLKNRVPESGPLLVVCNHPYGGIEALLLAQALSSIRTDIKFLANSALGVFRELRTLFIATNPLRVSQKNLTSIRECKSHLTDGGVLVLFPAGRVSSHQPAKGRITDGQWNRMVGHLAATTEATLLPVFFHGTNSRLFHLMGRLWDRSKLLMLPREFLKLRGHRIRFSIGRPLSPALWRHMDIPELTAFARTMTYLQQEANTPSPDADGQAQLPAPLAPPGSKTCISEELNALPPEQRMLDFKSFSVFHAMADQIPALMGHIGRERERVFRLHDEGSGNPRDTDDYDRTYVQLFAWDHETKSLVGAYRLGKVRELRKQHGPSANYLSQMFEFDEKFHDSSDASLELGRSFVAPEHQKSFYGLYLLWQGIGRFLVAHPEYRRLYGTVSLSRRYDERAVALLCHALIEPSPHVRPRHTLCTMLHPEWHEYQSSHAPLDLRTLSAFVRGLDTNGLDIPILLKHYYKLGAQFHCVGIDPNFNHTPGLLLSIDIPRLTPRMLTTFLGDSADAYLAYRPTFSNPGSSQGTQTIRTL